MLQRVCCVAGVWVLGCWLLATGAAGQVASSGSPELAGIWKGPLAIPGGSLPIQLTVIQPGANKLSASLDLSAKRLNRIPASVTFRGDSVVFFAAASDCRFVCRPSSDGQELRGT